MITIDSIISIVKLVMYHFQTSLHKR